MVEVRQCKLCSKTISPESEYCSTACDVARRLPLGEADLPVTWQLGVALGWFFALFNQLLFLLVSILMRVKGDEATAGTFALLSLAVGILVTLFSLLLFFVSKPKRGSDWAILFVCSAMGGVLGSGVAGLFNSHLYGLALFNVLLAGWLSRGQRHLRSSKKRQNR